MIQVTYLQSAGNYHIVDNVAGEEEGVDEAAILVAEGLGSDSRLCGEGTGECEEDGKDPERVDYLGGEAGRDWFNVSAMESNISNIDAEVGNAGNI